jgi:hypothetical protein
MRELESAVYWAIVGALISFGGFGIMSIGLPFLAAGWILAFIGLFTLGFRGVWAITVGLGAVPVYLLVLFGPGHNIPLPTGEEIAGLVFFGAIALSGPVLRLVLLIRGRSSGSTSRFPS